MFIIGILLLAAAIVVGIEIGISNDRQVDVEAFNHVWSSNPAAAFLVGVVTALVGAFGLWLTLAGMRRSRVRRRERRAEIAERDRLADERRREIDAMSTAGRGDRENRAVEDRDVDDRTVAADYGDRDRDDRDRERVPADRRDDVDLRDQRDDGAMRREAEHHGRDAPQRPLIPVPVPRRRTRLPCPPAGRIASGVGFHRGAARASDR